MRLFRFARYLFASRNQLSRIPALLASNRVPMRLKLMALGAALLILSPLNILGDIPLLGIADDVALFGMLAAWFVRNAESSLAAATLDGDYLVARTRQVS